MRVKWQWFIGGTYMFWVSIVLFVVLLFIFLYTYIIDPITALYMDIQHIDASVIEEVSKKYVENLGITIEKPIVYRFVKYKNEGKLLKDDKDPDAMLLGTFHEWNGVYFIDISANLYRLKMFNEIVEHETRHMVVQELKNRKIINLDKYTENIAQQEDSNYNFLFYYSVNLLKEEEK